jgi:hypothetical protein
MKKFRFIFPVIVLILSITIYACHKDKDKEVEPVLTKNGTLKLQLESDINGSKIKLNSVKYLNEHLDTFTVSSLKYYISNIRLKDASGNFYTVPESYYLIDVSISNDTTLIIPNIPEGDYIQAEVAVGIDSIRNHTGAQTGALDPTVASVMFWSWSAGYKFVVLEGTYKTAGSNGIQPLVYHIADDPNFKIYTFNAASANWTDLTIREGKTTKIKTTVNFEEMFKSPNTISFDIMNNVAGGAESITIANNYADMIRVTEVVNE